MSFFKSNKKVEENTKLLQEILELTQIVKNHETTIEKLQEESIQSQRTIQDLLRKQNLENAKTQFIDKTEEKTDSIEPKFIEVSYEDNHNHFGFIDIKGNGELFMGGADGHTHAIKNGFVHDYLLNNRFVSIAQGGSIY